MKLVTCVIVERLPDRNFPPKEGKKSFPLYQFKAFETDFDGARIPCLLETYNDDVRDFLENQSPSVPIYIPFSASTPYAGKEQYRVSNDILHPQLMAL